MNFVNRLFQFLCSLKLAVVVILSIAAALAAATVIESLYDTPSAQYWVYRSFWFYGLMATLGINIFCVAVSRLPWKRKHIPFLLAHLGILILLAGSWITERWGIDGNLRITEGDSTSVVELDQASLFMVEDDRIQGVPIKWRPPSVSFRPFSVKEYRIPYDLKVDQFLSHADMEVSFIPDGNSSHGDISHANSGSNYTSAVKLKVTGGPMGISEEIWLWEGSPGWKSVQAGPARFSIERPGGNFEKSAPSSGPSLTFYPQPNGSVTYLSQASDGKKRTGVLPKIGGERTGQAGQVNTGQITTGWKGNVVVTVEEWIPHAMVKTHYKEARIQYGPQAPTSAIHVSGEDGRVGVWLGLGDRAVLHLDQREIEIGYLPRRIMLPFSVRLDRFTVEHDQGTMNPSAYSSRVTVTKQTGQEDVHISMNEPLEAGGFTLYQASYEEAEPRPITSILSVNRDPGRIWKYLGSALIVLGSALLFAAKYRRSRSPKTAEAVS